MLPLPCGGVSGPRSALFIASMSFEQQLQTYSNHYTLINAHPEINVIRVCKQFLATTCYDGVKGDVTHEWLGEGLALALSIKTELKDSTFTWNS